MYEFNPDVRYTFKCPTLEIFKTTYFKLNEFGFDYVISDEKHLEVMWNVYEDKTYMFTKVYNDGSKFLSYGNEEFKNKRNFKELTLEDIGVIEEY